MAELDRRGDAELGKARDVRGIQALRVLDPLAQPEWLPELPRHLERIERLAVGPVTDRVDGDRPAGGRSRADQLGELLAARDAHAAPVEHPRGLRPEGAVHERLEVAEPQVVVADPRPQPELPDVVDVERGERLPHTRGQTAVRVDPAEDRGRTEPAILVVDRAHTARIGPLEPFAGGRDPLVLGDGDVLGAEVPRRLLAEDAGRLTRSVPLDDAAGDLELAARSRQCGGVEP